MWFQSVLDSATVSSRAVGIEDPYTAANVRIAIFVVGMNLMGLHPTELERSKSTPCNICWQRLSTCGVAGSVKMLILNNGKNKSCCIASNSLLHVCKEYLSFCKCPVHLL